jgi:hypothetical protein
MDILALIDGAIADVETSADAMRWTPDPVEKADDLPDQIAAFCAQVMAADLTAWQRDFLARSLTREFYAIGVRPPDNWEWQP